MSSVFGITSGENNYFNTVSGVNSSSNSSKSSFGSALGSMLSSTSALGDYSLIQSGTYKKLLNAYYSKNSGNTAATAEDKTELINLNSANSDANALSSSVNKLMSFSVDEDNRANLKENLKSVVENYNKVIDSASEVDNTSVLRQALWMTQTTSANAGSFQDLGISIGDNNKLVFDEEKFDKADIGSLKSALIGKDSIMGRLASRGSQIASASLNALSGSKAGSTYNRSANYTNLGTSNLIDTLT